MTKIIHTMTQHNMCCMPFLWVPWGCHYQSRLVAWTLLPAGFAVGINCGVEPEEREVASFGPLLLTRLETPEEREERKEAEAEDAFMEHEMNRYCEWSY